MKVHKLRIAFKTNTWLIVTIDSGTWVLGDSAEDVRVDLATQGMMGLSRKTVTIGHVGVVPAGSETTAVVLVETDSDMLTGVGETGGHFSIIADGGRVEFDSSDPSAGPFTLRLTKASPD